MFDVGLQELALIFGVSLVVLGPKRMSGLVTKVGRWVGKARTMARDFQQQLENEVHLEELHKMTELQSQALPTPPPGLNGEPAPAESLPTYPYSAPPEPAPTTEAAVEAVPSPSDDTYSHAHAEGAAPMPWQPEPVQADLDLTPAPNDAPPLDDLPPDDARRHS